MIELKTHPDGTLLPVQAQPGARTNGIVGVHGGRLKVAVTQIPEKGKANKEILKVLAKGLGLKGSQVQLVGGETSPQKTILVLGESPDSLRHRLSQVLGQGGA